MLPIQMLQQVPGSIPASSGTVTPDEKVLNKVLLGVSEVFRKNKRGGCVIIPDDNIT